MRGEIGKAARAVAKILHPHFVKEEKYALPPLGLLSLLAKTKFTAEMKYVLKMTDRVQADLPQMLQEHKTIVSALRNFSKAARKEKMPEYVNLAEKLIRHAKMEEEVFYPAAMLIGEYVELREQL